MIVEILPILFHRVGLILSFVSSVILYMLPLIFDQEDDFAFVQKLSRMLKTSLRLGLLILVITGVFRLSFSIPQYITIKLVAVFLTIVWSLSRLPQYPAPDYQQNHMVMVGLICLSAAIGIWL